MIHKVFSSVSCLVFLFSLISFVVMVTSVDQCNYLVRVKTGDVDSAGTNSNITLKLMSSSGGGGIAINNLEDWGVMGPDHDYFEKGNLDIFNGKDTCVDVCSISVISNDEGNKPGWYLEFVEVTVTGSVSRKMAFPVNQWLALDEPPNHLYANVNLCASLNP